MRCCILYLLRDSFYRGFLRTSLIYLSKKGKMKQKREREREGGGGGGREREGRGGLSMKQLSEESVAFSRNLEE